MFRQNGSCSFCSRKRAWASALVLGQAGGILGRGRASGGLSDTARGPHAALEPTVKTTSGLNGMGRGAEKAFRGLEAGVSARDDGEGRPGGWPALLR